MRKDWVFSVYLRCCHGNGIQFILYEKHNTKIYSSTFCSVGFLCSLFFGKNVQSMLKLGRAQGVAIVAALTRDIPVTEYAPLKIKMAITGNGQASKEQVADMLKRMLHIPDSEMGPFMDATDALGAAYCHYLQMGRPEMPKAYSSWKDFIAKNPGRIKK